MNKNSLIYFGIGLAVLAVVIVILAKNNATNNPPLGNSNNTNQTTNTAVTIEDLVVGEGAEAQIGSSITVRYTGKLDDGTIFDTTDGQEPRTFTLAQGSLIEGWVEGIPGMKVGGKRRLVVPAAKAYGESGQGSIPPNADLTFEIELVNVE